MERSAYCQIVLQLPWLRKMQLKVFTAIVIGQHVEQCIAGTSNEEVGKRKLRELLAVSQRYVE